MSAYIGLGITNAAKNIQNYERGRATREAQQAEALNRKKLSEMQLNEYEAQAPLREQETEQAIAESRLLARRANQQHLKSITFGHFDKYEADGDVRHLNNMLRDVKSNPIGAKANSPIVRYDELSDTPEIRQMMQSAGYSDFDSILKDPQLNKSFVVTTDNQGQKQVWDVDKVYAATGYGKHMTNEKLEQAKKRAQISELMRKGHNLTEIQQKDKVIQSMMQEKGIAYHEAWRAITEAEKGRSQGQDFSAIEIIAKEEEISFLEAAEKYYSQKNSGRGQTDQERFVQDYIDSNPGSTREQAVSEYRNITKTREQKNTSSADAEKDALDEMDFFNINLAEADISTKNKMQRHVAKIQEFLGVELSNEDKRTMRDLNVLTSLGKTAGEKLTPQETGLLDSTLNSFKKYMFNEVGGSTATSAYETFRNIFRNALYGSALTEAEIKAFNTAAGTLGNKFQPALNRMNTQMKTIKNQLETIRNTNDPYIAHFYLSSDIDNIDNAIRQIESRLDLSNEYESKMIRNLNAKDIKNKPTLDELFEDL